MKLSEKIADDAWSMTNEEWAADARTLEERTEAAETKAARLAAALGAAYAQAMADAEAIVRAVFDETPGSASDVYTATVQALRRAADKARGDE